MIYKLGFNKAIVSIEVAQRFIATKSTHSKADIASAPLRDCISYYNGHGEGEPGSLSYYGGGQWHKFRIKAQKTLDPYVFEMKSTSRL